MITNYERIKNMTVDETAEFMMRIEKAIFDCVKSSLVENGIEISGFSLDERLELYKQWLLEKYNNDN